MIRYYRRGIHTRTAETRRMAQRITRKGWRRCTHDEYMYRWCLRDMLRFYAMRVEAYYAARQAEAQAAAERSLVKIRGV